MLNTSLDKLKLYRTARIAPAHRDFWSRDASGFRAGDIVSVRFSRLVQTNKGNAQVPTFLITKVPGGWGDDAKMQQIIKDGAFTEVFAEALDQFVL